MGNFIWTSKDAVDYAFSSTISAAHNIEQQLLEIAMRKLQGKENPAVIIKMIRERLEHTAKQ